jgi:hypothetical protein
MLYDSTKTLLRSILQSLKSGDEAGWDDKIESGNQALYEMHQMSGASYRPYKMDRSNARWATRVPDLATVDRAMPYVKLMVSAIRRRDQSAAIESGQAALAEMNSASPSRSSASSRSAACEDQLSSGRRRVARSN